MSLLIGGMSLASCDPGIAAEQPGPDRPVGFFAIGSSFANGKNYPRWIPQMTAIGIQDLRSVGGTGWGEAEIEPGEWDFLLFHERLDYLRTQGVQTGVTLIGSPPWYSNQKKRGLPVNDIEGWKRYVGNVVTQGKGKIRHYQVWNEPPNGTNDAPPSDYAKILVAAYEAAKAADPDCLVGMATKSVHVNYLEQVIQAGGKGHYDYITLHPYEVLGCVERNPGTEQVFLRISETLRKMLAAQDPDKVDVPIWFTELGYDSKRGEDRQASALVKAYAMSLAQGIKTVMWFEGMDGDSGPLGLLTKKGDPRPAYGAMAKLIEKLGQHPKFLGWVLFEEKHLGFVAQGAGDPILITWAASKEGERLKFSQSVQITDPLTGEFTEADQLQLTPRPVIIDNVPSDLVQQAKANFGKRIPWGGDYTEAKSVSVAFGKPNVEKGLHAQAGQGVAEDVVAYGGNARAGAVPGGNMFLVDSGFLNYTTQPIEISAVVRLSEKNAPAALELEYESTSGFKKAAPYQIPDNENWHTATWRIDDPQFVSMWAFNFRFSKGPYYIQSVTVTKIDP